MNGLNADAIAYLREPHVAVVSTFESDGSILSIVAWVDADDEGQVLLNTVEGRRWQQNLVRDPRVAIAVPNEKNSLEYLSLSGRVVEQDRAAADDHIDLLSIKYYGRAFPYRQPGEVRLMLVIRPVRVVRLGWVPPNPDIVPVF